MSSEKLWPSCLGLNVLKVSLATDNFVHFTTIVVILTLTYHIPYIGYMTHCMTMARVLCMETICREIITYTLFKTWYIWRIAWHWFTGALSIDTTRRKSTAYVHCLKLCTYVYICKYDTLHDICGDIIKYLLCTLFNTWQICPYYAQIMPALVHIIAGRPDHYPSQCLLIVSGHFQCLI